ncbi:hypothetical protein [Streptomyces sp. NPDC001678]|uniref:hypothetical protein n=1 Tax=Streptomyces sp. NPDC001678 TaxID=3364599 RepID=UPI003688CA6E
MSTCDQEQLILRRPDIIDRTGELFREMSLDAELRERFVKNPSEVLCAYTGATPLPPQVASASNQLLYAVFTNPDLLEWLRRYAQERRGRPLSETEFMADFGRAVIEHGGDHAILALLREVREIGRLSGPDGETFITSSAIIASGVITRTDVRVEGEAHATQSFTHSSEFSTGGPPTEARHRDAGIYGSPYVRVTIDSLIRYAAELRERGSVLDKGRAGDTHAD